MVGGNLPVPAQLPSGGEAFLHNSPALAANPKNPSELVLANRTDSPSFSCAFYHSSDGGRIWSPYAPVFGGSDAIPCFAPDVAFTGDGKVHAAYTSFAKVGEHGSRPQAIWVSNQDLSKPIQIGGANAFHLRIAGDPASAGRLYAVWVQAADTGSWGLTGDKSPILISVSNDGGKKWSSPTEVSSAGDKRPIAPAIAIGKGGEVLVAYLDVKDDDLDYLGGHEGKGGEPYQGKWALKMARSGNRGGSWTHSVVDGALQPAARFLMLFPPTPALAADRESGKTYIGFQDRRGNDVDTYVWSSENAKSWEKVMVNDSAAKETSWQYLPSLSVADNGRLDVLYYDRQADKNNVLNEVSLRSSGDEGQSFGKRVKVSDVGFTSGLGYGSDRDMPEFGTRLGLVSGNPGAVAAWADSRNTHPAVFRQEIAYAHLRFDEASSKSALKTAGRVLLVGGELLLAFALYLRIRATSGRPTSGRSA